MNNALRTTSTLIAGLGLCALPALADGPVPTHLPSGGHPLPPVLGDTQQAPSGGIASGIECVYDNFIVFDDFGAPASQKDVVYPFHAEAADDFILPGALDNPCLIAGVTFSTVFFNNPVGVDPGACWEGVKVTIYEDISAGVPVGDPNCPTAKGPAGYHTDTGAPNREQVDCLAPGGPPGIVCDMKIPMPQVDFVARPQPCTGPLGGGPAFDIFIFGLEPFNCVLEKNHKYWISISPVMQFGVCGQTAIRLAAENFDHPAQQIFVLLGLPWTPIAGNTDACPPDTSPAGAFTDLAIRIDAVKVPDLCPWDCDGDGIVGITDLLNLLARWGPAPGNCYDYDGDGMVGITDLLKLLANWGPC